MILDDIAAKRLISAVLKQAIEDYTDSKACPEWCTMYDTCEVKNVDANHCSAKRFIHSTWAATLCDGAEIDHSEYVRIALAKCRLSKNTYKYIEGELRGFRRMESELEQLKNDIINSTPPPQEGHSSTPGNPTQSKAVSILKDKKIVRQQAIVDAIRKIYNQCDKKVKFMIDVFYFDQRYTAEGVACKLDVNRSTINRWRNNVVYSVAIELNYL